MTRRILASLLVVLAFSPFTAPFTTCDLSALFGHATGLAATAADTRVAERAGQDASPIDNDALLIVSLFDSTSGRAKALPIAPYNLQPPSATNRSDGATPRVLKPIRLRDGPPVAPMSLRL
jgi:hypothetical protein